MLYRVALLIGVARVAGFAQTPSAELGARSTYKGGDCSVISNRRDPKYGEKWDTDAEENAKQADAFCVSEGMARCPLETQKGNRPVKCTACETDSYTKCFSAEQKGRQANLPREHPPRPARGAVPARASKNCFVDNWCYFREGDYNSCEYFKRGCETPGSSDCQSYERLVTSGKCKPLQEAGESTFCVGLAGRTKVEDCSTEGAASCEGSYTVKPKGDWLMNRDGHDYTMLDFPDNAARLSRDYANNEMYQACEFKNNACRASMDSTDTYQTVSFCGDYCPTHAERVKAGKMSTAEFLGTTKCNQGLLDETPSRFPYGLPARLGGKEKCESTFFEVGSVIGNVYQGCEWLGPLDFLNLARIIESASNRCKPTFYCTDAIIAQGQCNPACNCMPMLTTACSAAQIMCCDGVKCKVCEDNNLLPDAGIYPPLTVVN